MPTYDFACRTCRTVFEEWVRKADEHPPCPSCGGSEVERQLSLPTVHSTSTRARSMKAAKRRDDRQQSDNMRARLEYEANHD